MSTLTIENSRQTILDEYADLGIKPSYSWAWGAALRLGYTEEQFLRYFEPLVSLPLNRLEQQFLNHMEKSEGN